MSQGHPRSKEQVGLGPRLLERPGFALPLRILREHLWLIVPILLYAALGQLVTWALGLTDRLFFGLYAEGIWKVFGLSAFAFAILYPFYVMIFKRPERLVAYMARDLRDRVLTPERLLSGLLVLAVMPIFLSVFTSFKILIPIIHPFGWDPTFAEWDRLLHGGRYSWELLQPLLGRPLLTSIINAGYHLWFFILFGIVFWQAFSLGNKVLRAQFFLAFLLTWAILGNGAATLLSSVGPCYYGAVVGEPNPFAPLMQYLQEANEVYPVWALGVQDMLWQSYHTDIVERGHGISAMPSMHVAAALLFALVSWRVDRRLGALMIFFTLLIQVGSVHLGWHYAIDGYVSLLATVPIWRLAGWIVARAGGRIAEPAPAVAPAAA